MPKGLDVSIRQVGAYFRVVYQRQYPNAVEDVMYSQDARRSAKVCGCRTACARYLPQFVAMIRVETTKRCSRGNPLTPTGLGREPHANQRRNRYNGQERVRQN
jgi:hypothetical protein